MSGSHEFVIKGYSLTKGMGIGKYIVSEIFIVGEFQWAIYFFLDGRDPKDNAAYVSVFVALHSESTNVCALFDLTLLDLCKKGEHKVHSNFSHSLTIGPYTLINHGSMWLVSVFSLFLFLENKDWNVSSFFYILKFSFSLYTNLLYSYVQHLCKQYSL